MLGALPVPVLMSVLISVLMSVLIPAVLMSVVLVPVLIHAVLVPVLACSDTAEYPDIGEQRPANSLSKNMYREGHMTVI